MEQLRAAQHDRPHSGPSESHQGAQHHISVVIAQSLMHRWSIHAQVCLSWRHDRDLLRPEGLVPVS